MKLLNDMLMKSNGKYCINKFWFFISCMLFTIVIVVELIRGEVRYDMMLLFMASAGGIGMINKGLSNSKSKVE